MQDKQLEYGNLVTVSRSGIVNLTRIHVYRTDSHNCFDQLIHSGMLYYRTDQDEEYGIPMKGKPLTRFDRVYFNGVLIYKMTFFEKVKCELMRFKKWSLDED